VGAQREEVSDEFVAARVGEARRVSSAAKLRLAGEPLQGRIVNSRASLRFVDFGAGGSRYQACALNASPGLSGAPSEPGFAAT
jgi:hypothetical protein